MYMQTSINARRVFSQTARDATSGLPSDVPDTIKVFDLRQACGGCTRDKVKSTYALSSSLLEGKLMIYMIILRTVRHDFFFPQCGGHHGQALSLKAMTACVSLSGPQSP